MGCHFYGFGLQFDAINVRALSLHLAQKITGVTSDVQYSGSLDTNTS